MTEPESRTERQRLERQRDRSSRWRFVIVAGVSAAALMTLLALWFTRPRLSGEDVERLVYSTIQKETPQSFLVTGALDVVVTTRVRNTRYLMPGVLDLSLGTNEAVVRVPGRVSYGFLMKPFTREMIEVRDSVIQVALPRLRVYSADPNLAGMEVETSSGWARVREEGRREVERRAIGLVRQALIRQGMAHLRTSDQPKLNTARAMSDMLVPVLEAAGLKDPKLRFIIKRGVVLER